MWSTVGQNCLVKKIHNLKKCAWILPFYIDMLSSGVAMPEVVVDLITQLNYFFMIQIKKVNVFKKY